MGLKELYKEYSRLRRNLTKVIGRDFAKGNKRAAEYMPGGQIHSMFMKSIAEIKALPGRKGWSKAQLERDMQLRIEDLQRIKDTGDIGIRAARQRQAAANEAILETLHESGYEHISKSTLKSFGRFMDAMREQYGKKLPNSIEMAEFFNDLKYRTKKKSTSFIVELWNDYVAGGYDETDSGNRYLFRS